MFRLFEWSVAVRYLIPRKKQLSVSLISLMSVGVIALVVWLLLLFLSVTEGIERGWLKRLTTLNAPLRVTPTEEYYASYYYNIDALSASSRYQLRNLSQKREAAPLELAELEAECDFPTSFPAPDLAPTGELKDPIAALDLSLKALKEKDPSLAYQDFEMSGALLRLQLLRKTHAPYGQNQQNYLTQVSYLATFPTECPKIQELLLPPSEKDLNHLLYLAGYATERAREDSPALTTSVSAEKTEKRRQGLLNHLEVEELISYPFWKMPGSLLEEGRSLKGTLLFRREVPLCFHIGKGEDRIWKKGEKFLLESKAHGKTAAELSLPLYVDEPVKMQVLASDSPFTVKFVLQDLWIEAQLGLEEVEIAKGRLKEGFQEHLLKEERETGIWLAKSFQEGGVLLGDRGYLAYSSLSAGAQQEQRLPVFVAGFYDPGVFSIGNKCILVPPFVTETINAGNTSFNLDKTQSNGVLVWFDAIDQAEAVKQKLISLLEEKGVGRYWKVTTFREYDFAKDLLGQFSSDRNLFTLVGIIILLVACCNIISLLVLLVNDKKKEIGILHAMGAKPRSIALIFGTCGTLLGVLGSGLGIAMALLTLRHIDTIVRLLSSIQGEQLLNAAFFGSSLPTALSPSAVLFTLIAAPLLSLLAGLLPALKACRLRPSEILRSE